MLSFPWGVGTVAEQPDGAVTHAAMVRRRRATMEAVRRCVQPLDGESKDSRGGEVSRQANCSGGIPEDGGG